MDLLSVGDATLDVFLTPTESEALCTLDNKECLICFSYGEKIPVKSLEYSIGGNAANDVVGTKRLGINSGMLTTLGGDDTGNQILKKLEKEGVDMEYVIQQPQSRSNFSTVINYSGERTIFTYKAPISYEFPVNLEPPKWAYLTSMGETFFPFYKHFAEWLNNNPTVKLAFNPGDRQIRADKSALTPILARTDIIYVNREEAEKIAEFEDSAGKDKELLKALSQVGPKMCIVTDGANGSYLYDSSTDKYLRCGIMPVDAYERTGAGDAFGSGFLSAYLKGKTLEEALLWGTVNSASVIGYTGAQHGLLTEKEMSEWLERAKSSGVSASLI